MNNDVVKIILTDTKSCIETREYRDQDRTESLGQDRVKTERMSGRDQKTKTSAWYTGIDADWKNSYKIVHVQFLTNSWFMEA